MPALMDITPIVGGLNDAQRAAVTAPLAPTLVLAGAGSGKTRVLTHRVAWLVQVEHVSPHGILAVTFTNKAAGEMRGRIETLLGVPSAPLWVGTFHGIAHRLLRIHWRDANLPQAFQIMDSDDQLRAIRKLLKSLDLDESRWIPKEIMWFINARKDEGLRAKHLKDDGDPTRRQFIRLYELYQEQCERTGVVDFAELQLRAFELWRDRADVLAHYRSRFRHVLIDEFQDTNTIQYAWLKLLAGEGGVPFAVGDDDQSIYRWRGARVENLQQFRRDYPGVQLFRLEQNYRSTGNILAAANALIANNNGRLGKNLWTAGEQGEPVKLYAAFNERDEADFVINRIREWSHKGGRRSDCAILYRSNAQSRAFEEALLSARIPYRVYGGLRFFERAEIKDALAYLRLMFSRADDASFERVVNLPARGIGAKTLDTIRNYARANTCTMWEAAGACIQELGARTGQNLHAFMLLIEQLDKQTRALPLHEQVDHIINASGLVAHYQQERGDRGEARVENLNELVSAAAWLRAGRRSADLTARELPVARGAGVRRGTGGRVGRQRADDDTALREGPGVSGRVPLRHGRRAVSAHALDHRHRRARRRTAPVLRRHDARNETPVPHLRGAAAPARRRQLRHAVALHPRDSCRAARRGAAAHPGVAARLHAAPWRRGRRAGAGRRAPRPARAPWQVRGGRDPEPAGPGEPRAGAGEFRAARHEVADARLRESRAGIRMKIVMP